MTITVLMLGKFVDTVLLCNMKLLDCFNMKVIISAYISTHACTMIMCYYQDYPVKEICLNRISDYCH